MVNRRGPCRQPQIIPTTQFLIRTFERAKATHTEYQALNAFTNQMRAEQFPDEPPVTLSEAIPGWQIMPAGIKVCEWIVQPQPDGPIVAAAQMLMPLPANQQVAHCEINVLPAYRRCGLARRLLSLLVAQAQREGRQILLTATTDRVPAAALWLERLGAHKETEGHYSQLSLATLDHTLIERWQSAAEPFLADFALGIWPGPYPKEHLAALAEMTTHLLHNTACTQAQAVELPITPADLRENERCLLAQGTERWTLYLQERTTGHFIGITDVYWNPHRPALLYQGTTAVLPAYRNRGLGRWLTAAMLDKVLRDRPQVAVLRTGNVDANAPMCKINQALGFKPYLVDTVWQVATAQVADYLQLNASRTPVTATCCHGQGA